MKLKGLRWWIVSLVGLATVINYIDRSAIAVMWNDISMDLDLTKADYAIIINVFMVAYAISQSLSGKLYDWVGTRFGFVISIVVWSAACALHGAARTLVSFSIFRAILGLGEAGNWPGATKSNAEWFPINERALAQGIFNSGASLGAVISAPLIALLYTFFGWQMTFVLVGLLGLIWILPWLILNRAEPDQHPWITEEERQYILTGQKSEEDKQESVDEEEEHVPSWGELLSYKESYAVVISRFFLDPIWWLFIGWLPIYLAEKFGFDIKQIGLFAWVPYVGAAAGSLFGGWISGYTMRTKGWSVDKARKSAIVLGGIIMFPSLILTAFASTPLSAVLLIAVILFGFQTAINNIQTLPSDFFTGKSVGSLAGLGGTAAVGGVLILNWLVPLLAKISYVPVFLIGAALVPLGVFSVYFFGGRIRRVQMKKR